MNADINAGAAIAQSKIAGLTTDLSNKQPLDAGLTNLSSYNTNGILVQSADNTFIGRSLAGTANRLDVTNGDGVSGNPTLNINPTLLPSPTASGYFLKSTGADASVWSLLSSGDITTALGFTPINKAGDTLSTGTIAFNAIGTLSLGYTPTNLTDATSKSYVDNLVATAVNQWTESSGNIYRNSGNVGIGTSSPVGKLEVIETSTGPNRGLISSQYSSDNTAANSQTRKARGTPSSPEAILAGDVISNYQTLGYNGTAFGQAGSWNFIAEENFTPTSQGTYLVLRTTSLGSTSNTEKMRITSVGNVGIGTAAPNSKLHIVGGDIEVGSTFEGNRAIKLHTYDTNLAMRTWKMATNSTGIGVNNLVFSTDANAPMTMTDMMTLTATGNVGIGTNAPDYPLTVNGNITVGVDKAVGTLGLGNILYFRGTENSTDSFYMAKYVASTDISALRMNIGDETSDYFVVGSSPGGTFSDRFWVKSDGSGWIAGTLTQASDNRLKKNVVPLNNSLEKILSLDGVYYDWISKDMDQSKQLGLIAQDVQKVYPEAVKTNQNGFLSVSYSNLIAPVIESIKEIYNNHIVKLWDDQKRQDRAIASIKEENKKLNQDNLKLKNENEMIKSYLCQKDPKAPFCLKK
jgi:hypothetical protein